MANSLRIWPVALILAVPALACAQTAPGAPASTPDNPRSLLDATASTLPPDQAKETAAPGPDSKEPDKLAALDQKLDALSKNLTVTTGDPNFKVVFGGAIITDFLYSSARQVAPGTPFFLTPGPVAGFRQQTFDANARPTTVFALVSGPEICGFQSSAFIAGCFYSSSLIQESLANVLAVRLIRHLSAPHRPERGRDGALPRVRLRAVVEYIEEHVDVGPSLEQMAAVARLSVYHFARQFKAATGLPPYQYVIMRRIERTKQLLQARMDLSLAEVAACAGFSDQSQFSHHFKRLVGVTPRQFRAPARIA